MSVSISSPAYNRTTARRAASFAVACLCAVLLLAGCSNDPNPAPLHTTRPDSSGSPWIVSNRALPEDPRSLDPQYSYDVLGNIVISQIYESLLQYNLFKTDPFELEPCLAESMPRHIRNPDGTEAYEFRLRPGLRFQDDPAFPGGKGREVTSADVAYTFQRIADPAVECPVLSVLQEFVAGLAPAYAEAKKAGKFDYSRPIAAVTVLDKQTFRINLLKPYPQILYWLAMPATAPVPREAVETYDGKEDRDQFKFHPVGTGPYRLAEWSRGRLIRLERNPHYTATRFPTSGWPVSEEARFRPLAGAPLPFVDEVQMMIIREAVPRWLLFRQGYLDNVGVTKDNFSSALTTGLTLSKQYEKRGVRLYRDVDPSTAYLQFNMDDPVLGQNRKLRQALSMAYNWERANEIFDNGTDLKSEQLLPPNVIGYDPHFKNPYRQFDLEKARQLLAEAGYPGGIDPQTGQPLHLRLDVVSNDSAGRQRAEFDMRQIEQLGVRCEIVDNTWGLFQDKQQRGTFQMNTGSGWHADYPDAENFFFLFYSKNIPPMGANAARFFNPEFDRLFEKMATMENGPERLAIIRRMNAILVEECPVIFLSNPVTFVLSQPWVPRISENAMLNTGGGMKYVRLDPVLRAQKRREWNRAPMWPTWVVLAALGGTALYVAAWVRRQNR